MRKCRLSLSTADSEPTGEDAFAYENALKALGYNRQNLTTPLGDKGWTAVHLMAAAGCGIFLKIMHRSGSVPSSAFDAAATDEERNQRPVHYLAAASCPDGIRLIASICGKDALNRDDSKGRSAAFYAIAAGSSECLDALGKCGANLNRYKLYGRRPIHKAAEYGDIQFLKVLLNAGVDINQTASDPDTTRIEDAKAHGPWAICSICCAAARQAKSAKRTAAHEAAEGGHAKFLAYLIAHGARIDGDVLNATKGDGGKLRKGHIDSATREAMDTGDHTRLLEVRSKRRKKCEALLQSGGKVQPT